MGNDLPDFQSQVIGAGLEATSFVSGLAADKPASPAAGDIWFGRDTKELFLCAVAGAWVSLTPAGTIIMWHGLLANIPTGWALCDGTLGTPNLIDKFVKGVATAATNPGTTGGSLSKTTAGHVHNIAYDNLNTLGATQTRTNIQTESATDSIADIRPPYYEVAYLMKI